MTRFRQALLDELVNRTTNPGHQMAPVRRGAPRHRLLASAGGAAAAAAAIGVVVASGVVTNGSATPAYAMATEPDGTVSITLNRLGDPSSVNQRLRDAGIRATIMLRSAASDCPAGKRGTEYRGPGISRIEFTARNVARLRPADIPAGAIMVIVPLSSANGGFIFNAGTYLLPGPGCVVVPLAETAAPADAPPRGTSVPR